ncbi:hypothetical protein OSTOST_14970, partial [Ostertagia ostertagi]
SNQSESSAPVNRRSLRSSKKVVNQAHQSNDRRTNSQASFASSYKNVTRKRGRPRLSHPIGKISTSKNRGRPRQSEAYTKDDKAKKNVKLSIVKVLRDCSRGSRSYTGAQTGGQIRRTGRKVVPQLTAVAERSQAGKICNLDSASGKHKKQRISKRGQDRLQNTAASGDDGKGVSPDCRSVEENLPKKKAAAKLAKAKERELKKAAKLERRQQKLEEQERKRRERLLRKEMKEKLLQQKREWREEEKRKRLARELQSMCKKRKLDSYLILDEVPSHRYGVIAYLVVEQSEAATQCVLYAQLADSSFASLPEEMYFVQIQSEKNRSSMFQTIVDARFIDASPQSPPFFYAIVLLR